MKTRIVVPGCFLLFLMLPTVATVSAERVVAEKWPIGVIARFDDHGTGLTLERAMASGVSAMQLKVPVKKNRTDDNARKILELVKKNNVTITCVISGFAGESYASIPIVKETVGLVPEKTRKERIEDFKDVSDFAKKLGVPSVQFHLGAVPHVTASQDYQEIVRAVREICDYIAGNDQWLNLETGQESGAALLQFLEDVDRPNLFVNFDPANMILYGCGEPNEALELVGKYVRSTHCKDALWSPNPREDWGTEVVFGSGDVNAEKFLRTLKKVGFDGPLIIERENKESPEAQYADVLKAIEVLNALKKKIL